MVQMQTLQLRLGDSRRSLASPRLGRHQTEKVSDPQAQVRRAKGMSDTNWVGKICPYCEKRLQEPDNVLVCERCGTPYHAACWYEHKGCKYHDGFGKPYDRSTPPPKEELRCPDCGARINAGAQFCSQCGHPLPEEALPRRQIGRQRTVTTFTIFWNGNTLASGRRNTWTSSAGSAAETAVSAGTGVPFCLDPSGFCTASCTNGRQYFGWRPLLSDWSCPTV